MTKIILLDSNSLINRAYYALPPLENKQGVVTNAIFGYLSMLARLITDEAPTHIGAVFDLKAPTFRHKMYDGYKATRKPMDEALAMQVPLLKDLLRAMGIKILELEGYEADDIIGTMAKRFDLDTVIVSGDRDVLQLVDENTVVYNTRRGVTDITEYDLDKLAADDFTPEKVIEYKALAGDSSDNIPGCPGVGEKTALDLLARFGSVDGVYEHIAEVKGKLAEKLAANKDKVYLSRELATINTSVPYDCTLDELVFDKYKISEDFFLMLNELECFKLIDRFRYGSESSQSEAKPDKRKSGNKNDDKDAVAVDDGSFLPFATELKGAEIRIIDNLDALNGILNGDIEKICVEADKDVEFAVDGSCAYKVKCAADLFDEGVNFDDALAAFAKVLSSEKVVKVLFDVKDKFYVFARAGVEIKEPYEDILLKSYLCNSNYSYKNYYELAAARGAGEGATANAFAINDSLDEEMETKGLTRLYRETELPLVKVLYDIEQAGFEVDLDVLNSLGEKYNAELKSLTEEIYELAGERFNINSVQQLGVILFEKLGLPHGKKTKGKTGYSVAAEILEELDHPVVTAILRYRKIKKLQSTYIEGIRAVTDPATHKVHTVFKQCLTSTGRLSSTEPNLQNIPIRTDEGREIRRMFVPGKGNKLVSADYSQIELRLLAHFSEDPVLTEAYRKGEDIHALTASKIMGVPLNEVTSSMRRNAKAVNFGIIYGISAFGLAKNTGIRPYEAKEFVEKYFETYPSVKAYMDANVAYAHAHGYIRTLAGRIRYFPEFRSPNRNIRNFGERAAMNMPLQGSAADIMKIAMLKVYDALKKGGYKAKIILQVHDELVIDTPVEEVEAVSTLLVENMQNVVELRVPLIAEAKSGTDWYSVE